MTKDYLLVVDSSQDLREEDSSFYWAEEHLFSWLYL